MNNNAGSNNSILMIAGADYADRLLPSFAKHLRAFGPKRFRYSLLGTPARPERSPDSGVFERTSNFPEREHYGGVVNTVRDLCSFRSLTSLLAGGIESLRAQGLAPLRNAARDNLYRRLYARTIPRLAVGFDLYHWHCLHWRRLVGTRYLPRSGRLILTIWGSDLLRCAGVDEYRVQFEACQRASVITAASLELREVLLAKFGRNLARKFRQVSYGADYIDIGPASACERESFLQRFGIPADKIVVVIGHSGHRQNQHLEVLERLCRLPTHVLKRIALLFPVTYGLTGEYKNEILSLAARIRVPLHLFDTFLSDADLCSLRKATDVLIHVPISDQFSAAMCESLAAGAVLITGAWLPYSRLRYSKVHYHEVTDCSELGVTLHHVIEHLDSERTLSAGNSDSIREIMAWSHVMPKWLQIYEELLETKRQGKAVPCTQSF
jgi:hypothetical protein